MFMGSQHRIQKKALPKVQHFRDKYTQTKQTVNLVLLHHPGHCLHHQIHDPQQGG